MEVQTTGGRRGGDATTDSGCCRGIWYRASALLDICIVKVGSDMDRSAPVTADLSLEHTSRVQMPSAESVEADTVHGQQTASMMAMTRANAPHLRMLDFIPDKLTDGGRTVNLKL